MSKWLREPLLHFIILGALIFFVYETFSDERGTDEIFISSGQQDNLINTFSRTWQRPPTAAEFKKLLDDFVREEIAYREGAALGLDDNDIIIRRRMRQKLELLAEDVASLTQPGDEQLQVFLDEFAEDYMIEARLSLLQIYFSPDRRDNPVADAATQLAEMSLSDAGIDIESMGDPIPLPGEIDGLRNSEIARLFGSVFADQLATVETASWAGPIESGFGFHLVFIKERIEGSKPDLDEVRDAVQRDWFSQRRREAVDGLYARLAENYQIEIEPPPESIAVDSTADAQVNGQ